MGRETNRSRRAKESSARERAAAMRAEQRAAERRRRLRWYALSGVAGAAVVALIVVVAINSGGGNHFAKEVMPPAVTTGKTDIQPAAVKVANTTGISGVVAYDTTGWPTSSNNGPKSGALGHNHVDTPVKYSVTPPVGGDHNATWMNCGIYDQPVPNERAVHNLEHGAIWITYQPSLPSSEIGKLRDLQGKQSVINGSRYVDVTPYPGLPSPIVISSWGFQLQVTSPTDPRLQQFITKFRYSKTYTPEYGGECTGGVGTPLRS